MVGQHFGWLGHFSWQAQYFVNLVKKVAETETSNIGFDIFNVNFSWCA